MSTDPTTAEPASESESRALIRLRLAGLTFVMLFLELALIRWLGANVLHLSYFSNVVLLGSFLGIGLGFLWAGRSELPLLAAFPAVLLAVIAFVVWADIEVQAVGGGAIFFGSELQPTGPPRELVLPVVFCAIAAIFTCIGDGVAREFRKLRNLDAYRVDIAGSLAGVVGFTVVSFLGLPPIVWAVVVTLVTLAVLSPKWVMLGIAAVPLLGVNFLMLRESTRDNLRWTPYYTVSWGVFPGDGAFAIVNGIPHWFQVGNATDLEIYTSAYDGWSGQPGRTLIVGAGSGNDVEVALSRGATSIDAVEIDPELLDLARTNHPKKVYDDPRVTTHIDDGRAFLERSDDEWDMILLALPDSITLVQGQSAVRLESFLFTEEAAESYRDHLTDDGVFAMYNLYRDAWLVDRYAATLEKAFGHPPCVRRIDDQSTAVLTIGLTPASVTCTAETTWAPAGVVPAPATDDYPFPYIKTRSIPTFYVISLLIMLVISLAAVRAVGGPLTGMTKHLDLFLMGSAFLLLETKNVVQFALLFGTTWFVNALVFGGVLVSILVAISVSERITLTRLWPIWALLGGALAVGYVVPQSALLSLPFIVRLVVAVAIAFVPIFAANVLFAQRFKHREDSPRAFAANLLGAMVGGTLEYFALITGFRNLLLIAAALYLGAYAVATRSERAAAI